MPIEISSLSPEIQRALGPTLLRMMTRQLATRVNVITEKSPQAEGEVVITITDNKGTPTEA